MEIFSLDSNAVVQIDVTADNTQKSIIIFELNIERQRESLRFPLRFNVLE